MSSGPDLFSLALFRAVARGGSIAAAAAQANLAPSAVSRRISDLEARYGTALLVRHRSGVDLTGAGADLLAQAEGVLAQVARLEAAMAGHAGGSRGTVRLAANSSAISQFLPEDLAEFGRTHPGLRVRMAEMTSGAVIEAVRAGRADLGVFSGLTEAAGLALRPYRRDTLVVATPADHPLAARAAVRLADLAGEPFVALQTGSSIQAFLDRRAEALGLAINIQVEVQSFDGVRRMVQAGLGIAVLPYGAVEPYLDAARLAMIPLSEDWAVRDLLIATRRDGALSPQAAALLATLAGDQ